MPASKELAELWPLHLKPQNDELLSSWLVRLASAHRLKLHTFCSITWPGKQIWNRDIDRSADMKIVEDLSKKTGTPVERVRTTTLNSYENILYEKHNTHGPAPWIMPVGVYHRTRRQFGLQYCPLCLAEDERPYYRRRWRLAFVVSCVRHRTLLHDRCPRCRAAVNFHRDEMGNHRKLAADSLTLCYLCRFELRDDKRRFVVPITRTESEFTTKLLQAMDTGFIQLTESVATHSQLYFAGLSQLMKVVAMRDERVDGLRRAIGKECGIEAYSPPASRAHVDVQERGIEERRQLLKIVSRLLEDWPHRFIELSLKYKVWSSLWLGHLDPPARAHALPAPFWLWSVVHDHLYRAKYRPSDEEIIVAIKHIKMNGNVVNKSALARLLGVAVIRGKVDLL